MEKIMVPPSTPKSKKTAGAGVCRWGGQLHSPLWKRACKLGLRRYTAKNKIDIVTI